MASARRFAWAWSSLALPCWAASWVAWVARCATCAACSFTRSISPMAASFSFLAADLGKHEKVPRRGPGAAVVSNIIHPSRRRGQHGLPPPTLFVIMTLVGLQPHQSHDHVGGRRRRAGPSRAFVPEISPLPCSWRQLHWQGRGMSASTAASAGWQARRLHRDPPRRRTPLGAAGVPSSRRPAPGLQRHVSLLLLNLSPCPRPERSARARLASQQKERNNAIPDPPWPGPMGTWPFGAAERGRAVQERRQRA